MSNLNDRAASISDKESLAWFLAALADSLQESPEEWENGDLGTFIRAWAAWLHDSDGYFRGRGELPPEQPSWGLIAQMLLAARIYE